MKSIYATLSSYNNRVYAPQKNYAAISAQSRANAESAVNPLYTSQLTQFLEGQGIKRAQQQAQYSTNISNLEESLKNKLEENRIAGDRTAEDVATKEADIANTADQYQTDTGQQFDAARLDLARKSSTGGLGQQAQVQAQTLRNTDEARKTTEFKQAKDQQELFKTRTFEDLARSGKLAGQSTETGKKQEKFNLDSYIANQGIDEKQYRSSQEAQRQGDILIKQNEQDRLLTNNWINSIANPAQRDAARLAYR
jgi:hypothetical protein